jgi:GGDEF domain-containing protein
VLLVLLGLVDYLTGTFFLAPFYLIPIFLVAWFGSRRLAFLVGCISTGVWYVANAAQVRAEEYLGVLAWNVASQLSIYLIFALLVTMARSAHEFRALMARRDSQTGMISGIFFNELVLGEVRRSRRYDRPFTLICIEFLSGHGTHATRADMPPPLLRSLSELLQESLRGTDQIARLDLATIAILLPETGNNPAKVVAEKLRERVTGFLDAQRQQQTFGMGVVTLVHPPDDVAEILRHVVKLAHAASRGGPTPVRHEVVGQAAGFAA